MSAQLRSLALAVRIEDEIARRGIKLRGGVDRCGPCPRCGGTDRFSINTKKQVFNCRGFEGGDVIALVQHIDGSDFKKAVATLAGPATGAFRGVPDHKNSREHATAVTQPPDTARNIPSYICPRGHGQAHGSISGVARFAGVTDDTL